MSKFHFDTKAIAAKRNIKAMLRQIGNIAVDHTKNVVFPSESFDGKAWKGLKKPVNRPILQKTKRLRRSIKILSIVNDKVVWGTDLEYGKYHNSGTARLPKRQFVGMDRQLNDKICKFISEKEKTLTK